MSLSHCIHQTLNSKATARFFFFQAEDGIRDRNVTGVQTCALPISGLIDREHRLPDLAEVEPRVAPDHDLGVRLGAHGGAQAFGEALGCDRLIADPQPRSEERRVGKEGRSRLSWDQWRSDNGLLAEV